MFLYGYVTPPHFLRGRLEYYMRRIVTYFWLELKKGLQTLPVFAAELVLAAGLAALLVFAVNGPAQQENSRTLLQVGIVIPDDNRQTKILTSMVENMESVQSLCSFRYLDADAAERELTDGEIAAVIYLNENLYQDIYSGANTPLRIKVADAGTATDLLKDLLQSGISLLQTAESGVYAVMQTSAGGNWTRLDPSDRPLTDLAMRSFMLIAARSGMWETLIVSDFGEINLLLYFAGLVIIGLTTLYGVGFETLYRRGERVTGDCLRRMGISVWVESAAKRLAMLLIVWVLLVLQVLLYAALQGAGKWEEILGNVPDASTVLLLLPLAYAIAGWMHLIYAFCAGKRTDGESGGNAGAIFFMLTLLVIVLTGGIVPSAYLPRLVQRIQAVSPIFCGQQYLYVMLTGDLAVQQILFVMGMGAVMSVIGTVRMRYGEA